MLQSTASFQDSLSQARRLKARDKADRTERVDRSSSMSTQEKRKGNNRQGLPLTKKQTQTAYLTTKNRKAMDKVLPLPRTKWANTPRTVLDFNKTGNRSRKGKQTQIRTKAGFGGELDI